jgi:hypothetical protein
MHIMNIGDGSDGNQTIYWDKQPVYTGLAFIAEYHSTILWLAVNMAGYMFMGVGDPNRYSLEAIATLPSPLMLDSNSMLYAHTGISDWTVTTLNWMSMVEPCRGIPSPNLSGGQSITFNYTLTNSNPLSMCNTDLSAILLEASDDQGYTTVWVSLPSAINAIIYLQDVFNDPRTLLTCTWSTPLSSQFYVSYGCIDDGCFSIYIIIGVYINSVNNTYIYVPLCNVSVLDAYIDGFVWNVLRSSITNFHVFPYPPIPTYAPITITSITSTTESNSAGNNSLLGGALAIVGILIAIIVLLFGVVYYR